MCILQQRLRERDKLTQYHYRQVYNQKIESIENISKFLESTLSAFFDNMKGEINAKKKQLSVLVLIILCFLLGCNRETPKDESQQNYEDESNISKTNGEELVNINSELLGSTPFDIQIDKTALQTRKETETEVTIKTNLTDWGYTVSSEKGKISDINKNSFIYIAPKDERDDTIKIQLSDYENGISYEYTIPLIFAGNNEHSLDKFKENLSRLPNSQ